MRTALASLPRPSSAIFGAGSRRSEPPLGVDFRPAILVVGSRRMEEGLRTAMTGKRSLREWIAILLLPILAPAALIAQMLPGKKTEDRTAAEVAAYLRDFIEGRGGEWDWDDFESVPITDPDLDRIRQEAMMAGPPGPDMVKLAELLRQVEALSPPGV
jgi:hypothetical protein